MPPAASILGSGGCNRAVSAITTSGSMCTCRDSDDRFRKARENKQNDMYQTHLSIRATPTSRPHLRRYMQILDRALNRETTDLFVTNCRFDDGKCCRCSKRYEGCRLSERFRAWVLLKARKGPPALYIEMSLMTNRLIPQEVNRAPYKFEFDPTNLSLTMDGREDNSQRLGTRLVAKGCGGGLRHCLLA